MPGVRGSVHLQCSPARTSLPRHSVVDPEKPLGFKQLSSGGTPGGTSFRSSATPGRAEARPSRGDIQENRTVYVR